MLDTLQFYLTYFWPNVYTVELMNRRWEPQLKDERGNKLEDDADYLRRRREQLVSDRKPLQVDMILPAALVRGSAIEVEPSVQQPYWRQDVTKQLNHGDRESHANKAELLEQINFACDFTQPESTIKRRANGNRTFVDSQHFDRLVFVRRRRATPREAQRYWRLNRPRYRAVGLPVDARLWQIRQFMAQAKGQTHPDWHGFWRDLLPHIRAHGRENLAAWWAGKHSKSRQSN
jgi:hypothetical protein